MSVRLSFNFPSVLKMEIMHGIWVDQHTTFEMLQEQLFDSVWAKFHLRFPEFPAHGSASCVRISAVPDGDPVKSIRDLRERMQFTSHFNVTFDKANPV